MKVLAIDSHILDHDHCPFQYSRGTRCLRVKFDIKDFSYNTFSEMITLGLEAWEVSFNEQGIDLEDMFITVGFSTLEIIVEVSDRMKD